MVSCRRRLGQTAPLVTANRDLAWSIHFRHVNRVIPAPPVRASRRRQACFRCTVLVQVTHWGQKGQAFGWGKLVSGLPALIPLCSGFWSLFFGAQVPMFLV